MADINDDQINALNDSIRELIEINKGLAAALGVDVKTKKTDNSEFGKKMAEANKSLDAMKNTVNAVTGTLGSLRNESGAQAYNKAIDSTAAGINKLGNYLSVLFPEFSLLIKTVQFATLSLAEYGKAVSKQADALYKSYQDLSAIGATTISGGLDEVFTNLQQFGYTVKQIGNLGALVKDSADNLAVLGGTVADGTAQFAEMSQAVRESAFGDHLRMMGFTIDSLNKGTANYLRLQAAQGELGNKTQEQLTEGAEQYLVQQDRLTKLTGASADEQAKLKESALSEERFGASIRLRERQAKEADIRGDHELASKLRKQNEDIQNVSVQVLKAGGKNLAQGMRDISTGFVTSPAARQFQIGFPRTAELIRKGADQITIANSMREEAVANEQKFDRLRAVGAADAVAGIGAEVAAMANLKDQTEANAKITHYQNDQAEAAAKNMTLMQVKQQHYQQALDRLVEIGIGPVTAAMNILAGAIETIGDLVEDILHPLDFLAGKTTHQLESKLRDATAAGDTARAKAIREEMAKGGGATSFDTAKSGGGGYTTGARGMQNASDVDKILSTIRAKESGGNYGAQAKGSSASGAYQYIDSTWQSLTKKFSIGAEFKKAKDAPKEIQDLIARKNVEEILAKNNGSLSAVANTWYTGNAQGKMSAQALAANNGLTAEKYASGWMNMFNKMGGPAVQTASTTPQAPIAAPTGSYSSSVSKPTDLTVPKDKTASTGETAMAANDPSMLHENLIGALKSGFAEMLRVQTAQLSVQKQQLKATS